MQTTKATICKYHKYELIYLFRIIAIWATVGRWFKSKNVIGSCRNIGHKRGYAT